MTAIDRVTRCALDLVRQGPRALRRRRRPPAHGGLGPDLGLRRDHGRAHPRQGPGAHGHDRGYWLEELADLAPNHLISADTADFPDGAAGLARRARTTWPAGRCWSAGPRCSTSSASSAATWPARRTRSTSSEGTVHGMAMPGRAAATPRRLPEPIFTPSTKATEGHDLNIGMAEAIDIVGREAAEAAADAVPGRLPPGGGPGRGAGHRHLRHQVRARATSTASCPSATRCSPRTRRGSGRPTTARRAPTPRPSTSSRCATGWRPSRGTSSRRPRRCPPRSSTATSARYVGGLRAGLRPVAGRLVRCLSMARSADSSRCWSRSGCAPGIADPQGATIERALPALGLRRGHRGAGRQVVPVRRRRRRRGRRPWPRPPWWPTGCWPTR